MSGHIEKNALSADKRKDGLSVCIGTLPDGSPCRNLTRGTRCYACRERMGVVNQLDLLSGGILAAAEPANGKNKQTRVSRLRRKGVLHGG